MEWIALGVLILGVAYIRLQPRFDTVNNHKVMWFNTGWYDNNRNYIILWKIKK